MGAKKKLAKRFIGTLAVCSIMMTSVPHNWPQVAAQTKNEVVFEAADYRKMNVGETYDFNLKNKESGAKYKWSSSDKKVAVVDKNGVVKAIAPGEAVITCKITKGKKTTVKKATVRVVKAKKNLPERIVINNKISSMAQGEVYDLNRTYSPKNTSDYVNWTSSNTDVATVDQNGVVTAKANGTVTIKAVSLNNKKVKDSVKITVSGNVIASTQKDIDRLLKSDKVCAITIKTKKDVELTIPSGDYSDKKLTVDAPNATILNYGTFKKVNIKSIKSNTWKEFAKHNKLNVLCNASIIVEKDADADITLNKAGIKVRFEINGKAAIDVEKKCDLVLDGSKEADTKLVVNARDTQLHAKIPVQMSLNAKVTLELLTKSAESSEITVKNESALPLVKGEISIKVKVGNTTVEISSEGEITPTTKPSSPAGNPSDPTPTQAPSDDRVKVDENGLDSKGRAVAYFGSPDVVDGEIEDIWKKAEPVKLTKYSADTTTKATLKLLWDDNALYFLAEVKDENLSDASGNVYEKDSFEIFVDEDNKRGGTYEGDDVQFRINYKNETSSDHGDMTNLYSAAKIVDGGYIVEGRVSLSQELANDKVMGLEAQINDATGSTRIATINLFDTTGTAFQDTSKFGELLLTGKKPGDVTKANFYDLKSLVAGAKEIELERYINGNAVADLITQSEKAIEEKTSTQAQYDELMAKLQKAIDELMHNDESFDEKECRDIPKAYKMFDPESQRGTIVQVDYHTNTYDDENKELDKYMLVYLPHGYDQNDKTKKYNVLYLIHGMSESQHTAFGGVGQNSELMRAVDNLIADGKMEPMIIVTPTWYNTSPWSPDRQSEDGMFRIKNFHQELTKDIIPTIEAKYNVYAKSTSEADLIAARDHRAVGGFSMGSACTWYNYIYAVQYFKWYVPISLWCWQDDQTIKEAGYTGATSDEAKAKYLADIPKKAGYGPDDIRIFCATGTADLAYGGMNSQIAEMKKLTDMFKYSADLRKGNFYYSVLPGGAHNWTCVDRYLYNILPDLFHSYWTNDFGLTEKGEASAVYGSPKIDGKIDAMWSEAKPIVPKYSSTKENTKATFRAMWDDKALYILAQVQDENITKDSTNPYEQDSMEIFLDQSNDKTKEFGADDLQFRINFANERTADKGDIARLYSKTSVLDGGYVIEARIAWDNYIPENEKTIGIELQINDGKGASRAGTINVFDSTGNAWQNTAVFGNLVLKDKSIFSIQSVDRYALLSMIDLAMELKQEDYTEASYQAFLALVSEAKELAEKEDATQAEVDTMLAKLKDAVYNENGILVYTEKAAKVKRFKAMDSKYKNIVTGSALTVTGSAIEVGEYQYTEKGADGKETEVTKTYNVYLPQGYDPADTAKKYNVFYLMHGGGENVNTLFGGPGQDLELKRILDNMIFAGEIEPMIVVTPSFYGGENDVATFYKELNTKIIPQVETKYNTYLEDESEEAMKASRAHRAFGGFSMGSACTWYVYLNSLDYIKYFVPLSGDCWALSGSASADKSAETAEYLAEHAKKKGLSFKLFCATGDADIAYPNMAPQMAEMEKLTDAFTFNKDPKVGNCYFMVAKGGTHAWNFVNQYLYIIMKDLFIEEE